MIGNDAHPSSTAEPGPRFPPMAVFSVFMATVEQLARRPSGRRDEVLDDLGDHDRSQVTASLIALELVDETGTYDDLALRRLADRSHRPQQLRMLLDAHYGPHLAAIARGAERAELDAMLRAPGRASRSAVDKARRFLKAAMRSAGLDTSAPALTRQAPQHATPAGPAPDLPDAQRQRAIDQHQALIDQLLAQRERQSARDQVDPALDARLDWHMRAVHRLSAGPWRFDGADADG